MPPQAKVALPVEFEYQNKNRYREKKICVSNEMLLFLNPMPILIKLIIKFDKNLSQIKP